MIYFLLLFNIGIILMAYTEEGKRIEKRLKRAREREKWKMNDSEKQRKLDGLINELECLENELEYQVSHKRIAYLQERIEDVESQITTLRKENKS